MKLTFSKGIWGVFENSFGRVHKTCETCPDCPCNIKHFRAVIFLTPVPENLKNLRSTMEQARLNHVAILNYHKTLSRSRNLETIVDQFIKRTATRGNIFLIKNQEEWWVTKQQIKYLLWYSPLCYSVLKDVLEWFWIVDLVHDFLYRSLLHCIDINSSYASPVCRLCFCERECVHVCVCVCVRTCVCNKEHTCVFIAAAAVNWFNVCFTVKRMCARVKIATSHASTVSTHQQKHKSAPPDDKRLLDFCYQIHKWIKLYFHFLCQLKICFKCAFCKIWT